MSIVFTFLVREEGCGKVIVRKDKITLNRTEGEEKMAEVIEHVMDTVVLNGVFGNAKTGGDK